MLGLGIMINTLGGNKDTVEAIKSSLNRTIDSVKVTDDDTLLFIFKDGSSLKVTDDGQSCCENRYMKTDDDLSIYKGAVLEDFELKDVDINSEGEWGEVHEIQFLDVKTSKGIFTVSNHNEHNGYYGGFWIKATWSLS